MVDHVLTAFISQGQAEDAFHLEESPKSVAGFGLSLDFIEVKTMRCVCSFGGLSDFSVWHQLIT